MSTQGSFIIRKSGADKAMWIASDAYPAAAGADICDLIKTTDLDVLYDCLTEYDETEINCPDEPEPFSYDRCRLAVKRNMKLWIPEDAGSGIRNSLFCEHAYVIDLDDEHMQYFIGSQTQPQQENPYGTQPVKVFGMDKEYYPCRLARVFSLEYIRRTSIDWIIENMERINRHDTSDIRYFTEPVSNDTNLTDACWNKRMERIVSEVGALGAQLYILQKVIAGLQPVCERRVRELTQDYVHVVDAVNALSERIEIMK